MDIFLKLTAGILLTTVICVLLQKKGADTAMLVSMAMCSMAVLASISFLQPIIDFCNRLQQLGKLDGNILNILLKAVGIGMIAQIAGLVCNDAGHQTLGKTLNFIAAAATLWITLPLFEELVTLLDTVLGAI